MKDSIDVAFGKFQAVVNEIENYSATIASESDTRLKVVDRILTEVLGWPVADISTSERAGTGFTDYVLRIGQSSRLVFEAKKDGISFELENRQSGQAYKLSGPVFSASEREAIEQAIGYNAFKNAELACASNGREWIIFRANRLGDGQDTMAGKAFIFSSLKGVLDNFTTFFDLLSLQSVKDLRYRGLFQEVEGLHRPPSSHPW